VHAIDSHFIALRGPSASINKELARLGLAPAPATGGAPSPDPPHASAVIAFARDNLGRFEYPPNVNVDGWVHDLRKLIRDGQQ
jgi:hypothetical protein